MDRTCFFPLLRDVLRGCSLLGDKVQIRRMHENWNPLRFKKPSSPQIFVKIRKPVHANSRIISRN